MSDVRGRPAQEGLKIRYYVMNLIYSHPGESVMLPTSHELAEKFGVARSTVTLVLKTLTEEGFIAGKRGVGTFTCYNGFIFPGGRRIPLVGLLYGDGKYFFHEYYSWSLLACAGRALTLNHSSVRHLALVGMTDDELFEELCGQYLDGLVWFHAKESRLPLIRRLEEAGIRVVTYGTFPAESGIDNFCFDWFRTGEDIGRMLVAEGRKRLFFAVENESTRSRLDGIRDACRHAGKKLDIHVFHEDMPQVLEPIEREIAAGVVPDAFYAHGDYFTGIREILARHRIDTENDCRLIVERHIAGGDAFRGIRMDVPFEQFGEALAQRMKRRLENGPAVPVTVTIPVPVRKIGIKETQP
mgnify:CR=1 FL=1